ncbi:MAG: hypothetical protein AB7F19_02770 [Candidatus Babeliales bacterium]
MNSLSKVTLLVTLLSVPFAGFAMDFADMPALEADVVVTTVATAAETAPVVEVVAGRFDSLKANGAYALQGLKNIGSAILATLPTSMSNFTPEQLIKAGFTAGFVVMGGKIVWDVYRAPKAITVNPQDTTGTAAAPVAPVEQPAPATQVEQPVAPVAPVVNTIVEKTVAPAAEPKTLVVVERVLGQAVVKPAPVAEQPAVVAPVEQPVAPVAQVEQPAAQEPVIHSVTATKETESVATTKTQPKKLTGLARIAADNAARKQARK